MLHSVAGKDISMFDVGVNILINPVNCIGIMGGGLALEFKNRYPVMHDDYLKICKRGFRPGMIHTFPVGPYQWVFNVPTKDNLSPSTEKIIKTSLAGLMVSLAALRPFLAKSKIAMPALGCGLGGMDWETEVKDLLVNFTLDPRLDDYEFILFEPK